MFTSYIHVYKYIDIHANTFVLILGPMSAFIFTEINACLHVLLCLAMVAVMILPLLASLSRCLDNFILVTCPLCIVLTGAQL